MSDEVKIRLDIGDCAEVLDGVENEYDAVICDPPYGLGDEPEPIPLLRAWIHEQDISFGSGGFMNASWDAGVPTPATFRACLRALKPGKKGAFFSGTRTVHLTMASLRLAGFEILGVWSWCYGSGFPKSMNVYKKLKSNLCKDRRYDKPGAARCGCGDDSEFLLMTGPLPQSEVCQEGKFLDDSEEDDFPFFFSMECFVGEERAPSLGRCSPVNRTVLCHLWKDGPDADRKRGRRLVRDDYENHEYNCLVCSWCLNPLEQEVDGEIHEKLKQDERYTVPGAARCECVDEDYEYTDALFNAEAQPDPHQKNDRKVILDDYGDHDLRCRVCSWCLLPDDDYVESLDGLGTALKPAHEPIVLVRKPEGPFDVDVEAILESYGFEPDEIDLIMTPPPSPEHD